MKTHYLPLANKRRKLLTEIFAKKIYSDFPLKRTLVSITKLITITFLCFNGSNVMGQTLPECGCSSFQVIGDFDETTYISEENINYNVCLDIRGTLVIDEPTVWDEVTAIMREASKIIVEDTLAIINNSFLTGCPFMWQGIHTSTGVDLKVLDSRIEKAEFGIKLADLTKFECRNVEFVDDFIGIAIGSPFDEEDDFIKITQEGQITGCTFYTDGFLPDPYPGQYYSSEGWPPTTGGVQYDFGFAAIYLENSNGLTFGSLTALGSDRNEIFDMRNGIIAINSTSTIFGSDFHDFTGRFPQGFLHIGLLQTNQVGIYSVNSFVNVEGNSTDNIMVGVWGQASNSVIKNNTFDIDNSFGGLTTTRGINQERPQSLLIDDNKIYNGFLGIVIQDATRPFSVSNNFLERGVERSNNEGIRIVASHITGSQLAQIHGNELEFDDAGNSVGISLNSVTGIHVDLNDISFLATNFAGLKNVGILSIESSSCRITKNNVIATEEYNDPETEADNVNAGIVILNSKENSLFCNTIENFNTNLYIIGSNNMTNLRSNVFYDGGRGFDLFGPARIGTQNQNGNQWVGNYDFGAYISGSDPLGTAELSGFIVDAFDDGGIYLPEDIGPQEVDNGEWFDHFEGIAHTCFSAFNPVVNGVNLTQLVREPLDFSIYEDEMTWHSYADIFDLLLKHDSLLSYASLDSFFDIHIAEELGDLMFARHTIHLIPDEQTNNKIYLEDLMYRMLQDIASIDVILTSDPNDREDWVELRNFKVDTIEESLITWLDILKIEGEDYLESCQDVLDLLDGITARNDQEDYLKETLRMQTELLMGNSLSEADSLMVLSWMDLCPWQAGYALGLEGILFAHITDSVQGFNIYPCSEPAPFKVQNNTQINIKTVCKIFPNPSRDQITVESKNPVSEILLHDVTSKPVLQMKPDMKRFDMDVSGIPAGVYLLSVTMDDIIYSYKIVIHP